MKIILFQEQKTDAKNIRDIQQPQEKGGLKEKERSVPGRPTNTRRPPRRSQSPRKTLSPEKAVSPTETSDSQSPVVKRRPRRARTQEKENTQEHVMEAYKVELQTKVHTKVRNHGEGPY